MNISLEWLGDFVGGALDAEAVGDALMRGGFPIESIAQVGADQVLDVEVTSNRGDCLSHVGVAREVAALRQLEFKHREATAPQSSAAVSDATSVTVEAAALCPQYTARVIRNVKIGPSPAWMVRRLEAVGLRSINNVVDVTNYVMFEMGQPLHAFDFDKLRGRKIVVREARAGEKIVSIDGHERTLSPGMLVIADAEKPVAVAGVMGGLESEVSEQTVNVLLESARFDPLSVRKTARALAMKSDSSYRFERGIDPTLPERASLRAAQLILEAAGGELLSGIVRAGTDAYRPKNLTLRLGQIPRILGIELAANEVVEALRRLQLKPKLEGETVTVEAPSWRLDLNIERDLVEEVARVIGYERIGVRDEISIRVVPPAPGAVALGTIRQTLVAAGYFEAVTFTFASDELAYRFMPGSSQSLPRADASVRKADARLRPSLLPGLLEAVRRNETVGTLGAKLFETGATFRVDGAGKVNENRKLALAGPSDYRSLRGATEALLTKLDAGREVRVIADEHPGFARGACGRVQWGEQAVGFVGLLEKGVADKLSLREIPAMAELDLPKLIEGMQHVPQLSALAKFPAVRRDLSLVLKEQTPFEAVESLVRSAKLPQLETVEYVTTYRGRPLEKGSKSLTITLVFRSSETTLTGEQVEQQVQKVMEAAGKELGAVLRT
ncbi:MAG TPA: phenylalanine--tRNA ligase subunit beta [Tepidisphaeraceae bacterium]|jgi:phenylalanyl-tRNA synthetase beta chain